MKHSVILALLTGCLAAQNTAVFPGAVATNQDLLPATSFRRATTISGAIGAGDLTITLASGVGWTTVGALSIEQEDIRYCNLVGNVVTVCAGGRGFNGTTAVAHPSGAAVRPLVLEWHHNQVIAEIIAIETQLGANLVNLLDSPLTTKGDLWTYSTVDTRLAVGLDGKCLKADSGQATGLVWGSCGDPLSGTVPAIPYFNTTTSLASSFMFRNANDITISASLADLFQPSLILRPDPTTGFPMFANRTSQGTLGAPTATGVANFLGGFVTQGHTGSAYTDGGGVVWYANENWTPTANGARMFFYVRPDGTNQDDTMVALNGTGPTLALGNKADETAFNGCTAGSVCVKDGFAAVGNTRFVVKAGAGQSDHLQEWQGNSGAILARVTLGGAMGSTAIAVASLPTCDATARGLTSTVNDSSVTTWGSTVAGGGASSVYVWCSGAAWTVAGGPAQSGITSLNGLTGPIQTLATGTTGTDFNIVSAGTVHTFHLPTASAANRGALSSTDWSIFNAKESVLSFSSPLSRAVNTVSCPTCEVTGNKNAASGYAGLTAGVKIQLAQAQEVIALADLTDVTAVRGNTSTVQLASGAITVDHCAKFDVNGNLVDAGAACSAGSGTVTHTAGALTLDLPVFGNGADDIKVGTKTGTGTEAVMSQSPTIVTPTIASLTNAQHTHADAAGGGQLDDTAVKAANKQGNGTKFQMFAGSAPTSQDCAKFDANGNIATNGAGCAPVSATYIVEAADGTLTAEVPLSTEINTGTVAGRPGAAVAGRLYLPSDGIYVYRDSGSVWANWGPAFPLTEPVSGDYAWINQGGATLDTTNGGVNITAPSNAGDSLRIRKKSKTGTYTIILGFNQAFLGDSFFAAGFVWRQSSDGKLVSVHVNQGGQIQVSKWNSPTSFSADYLLKTLRQTGPLVWFKMQVDSTNRITSISSDGYHWVQVHSIGKTDFMTADEVGYFVNSNNGTFGATATFYHWSEGS